MPMFDSQRRRLLAAAALLPLAAQAQQKTEIQVYKTPTCGCCNDWIKNLQANGFKVKATNVTDTAPLRARFGLAEKFGSCHTAMVAGYVVEGHVPVREIRRLLAERPTAVGIAVPDMPIGSPGMDGPAYKGQLDPYDVLLVHSDGSTKIYASYN
jgi:hypothetical protein